MLDFWYLYVIFLSLAGAYFTLMASANAAYFRLSRRRARWYEGPSMSVLVPARNEENRIRPTLDALVAQDYRKFEIIVIDDNSTDGTWEIIREYSEKHGNVRGIRGKSLPDGWNGKPFAMTQLAEEASNEILVFIDADIKAEPDFLAWTADRMRRHKTDSISAYARHFARTFRERLFFPAVYIVNFTFLPFWLIKHTRTPLISHAIGQLMVFTREAYDGSGGFAVVKDKILEDIHMARAVKSAGYRHAFLDARKVLSGYMYDSWEHTVAGLKRSIYEYFDKKVYPLIIMSFFLAITLILPPFLIPVSILAGWGHTGLYVLANLAVFAGWAITLWDRRQPWYSPFFWPAQFFMTVFLAWKSLFDDVFGEGYDWKDRKVK